MYDGQDRIVDHFRRKKPFVSLDRPLSEERGPALADILSDGALSPQSDLERREIHERLYRALDALPPEDQAIVLATEFEGATSRDLAEAWEEPLRTILARESRALKKIGKYLEASGQST